MKMLLAVVLIVMLLPAMGCVSCTKNEVEEYAKSLPFPQGASKEVIEIIKPLGQNGMDRNEKTLVDEISMLSRDIQLSGAVLKLLREIVQDNRVSEEELRRIRDLDGDGLVNLIDSKPLEPVVYEVPVDYLDEAMKKDALACIDETDKLKTFKNLSQMVYSHVPHALHPRGKDAYPNNQLQYYADELNYPRDPLSYYYSHHEKVLIAPVCNDIASVYDIMADYIIDHTGWDVDSDVFPCLLDDTTHFINLVNINGQEYVADAVYGIIFKLGENPHYDLSFDKGMAWRKSVWLLMAKFDKRYLNTIYDKNPIKTDIDDNTLWQWLRNQTPENEKKLEDLYLKIKI